MDIAPFLDRLQKEKELTLEVKVNPRSQRNEMADAGGGVWRVKVAAPPERGKANAELCAFLARQFGVPPRNVEIVRGATNPHKRVRIVL